VTAAGEKWLSDLSRRLDARLEDEARNRAKEQDIAVETLKGSLREVRNETAILDKRIESLSSGATLERQLKEASQVISEKVAARISSLEQRMEEVRVKEAAKQNLWRETVYGRCDAVERRLSKHHAEASSLVDRVTRMVPDIERVQELCDSLKADRANAEIWQRRVVSCEGAMKRIAAVEVRLDATERNLERAIDDQARKLQECVKEVGLLGARFAAAESSHKRVEQRVVAAEKDFQSSAERQRRESLAGVASFLDTIQQRFADSEATHRQQLQRLTLRVEQQLDRFNGALLRDTSGPILSSRLGQGFGMSSPRKFPESKVTVTGVAGEQPRSGYGTRSVVTQGAAAFSRPEGSPSARSDTGFGTPSVWGKDKQLESEQGIASAWKDESATFAHSTASVAAAERSSPKQLHGVQESKLSPTHELTGGHSDDTPVQAANSAEFGSAMRSRAAGGRSPGLQDARLGASKGPAAASQVEASAEFASAAESTADSHGHTPQQLQSVRAIRCVVTQGGIGRGSVISGAAGPSSRQEADAERIRAEDGDRGHDASTMGLVPHHGTHGQDSSNNSREAVSEGQLAAGESIASAASSIPAAAPESPVTREWFSGLSATAPESPFAYEGLACPPVAAPESPLAREGLVGLPSAGLEAPPAREGLAGLPAEALESPLTREGLTGRPAAAAKPRGLPVAAPESPGEAGEAPISRPSSVPRAPESPAQSHGASESGQEDLYAPGGHVHAAGISGKVASSDANSTPWPAAQEEVGEEADLRPKLDGELGQSDHGSLGVLRSLGLSSPTEKGLHVEAGEEAILDPESDDADDDVDVEAILARSARAKELLSAQGRGSASTAAGPAASGAPAATQLPEAASPGQVAGQSSLLEQESLEPAGGGNSEAASSEAKLSAGGILADLGLGSELSGEGGSSDLLSGSGIPLFDEDIEF